MSNALDELKSMLDNGQLFCKATDIAKLMQIDPANLRGLAVHDRHRLPFASYVIGRNIKFPIPCVVNAVGGEDIMTPERICALFSDVLGHGVCCAPTELAKLFNSDPNTIRRTIRRTPDIFGFDVLISARRIKVPVIPLIQSLTGTSVENIKAAIAALFILLLLLGFNLTLELLDLPLIALDPLFRRDVDRLVNPV